MKKRVKEASRRKLQLHRETLQRMNEPRLAEVAGAAQTDNGPACDTFSEPSACPTCLCT